MSLMESLENVNSFDSFLAFVDALIIDRSREGSTWQNDSIEDYLAAAVARARDSKGQVRGMSDEATWHSFAVFLYCGKSYE